MDSRGRSGREKLERQRSTPERAIWFPPVLSCAVLLSTLLTPAVHAQEAPEHVVLAAGIHAVKTIQPSGVFEIAGGHAEVLTTTAPYAVIVTTWRLTEPPVGPSRYAFLAFIADQQAMYAVEGRAPNEILSPISFALLWNTTPTAAQLDEYDNHQNLTHDDHGIVAAHATDNNHVTIWCTSAHACEEVRVDVRNALQAELHRQAAVMRAVEDLENRAQDLSIEAEPGMSEEEAGALLRRIGDAWIEAANARVAFDEPLESGPTALELRGPIRGAIVLQKERAQAVLEARIHTAEVTLDRAQERAFRVDELALRERSAGETRQALNTAATANWITAGSVVVATAVAVGLYWHERRDRKKREGAARDMLSRHPAVASAESLKPDAAGSVDPEASID